MFHSRPQSHGRRSVHYCATPKDTADIDRHCPTSHRPAASAVYGGNTLNIPKMDETRENMRKLYNSWSIVNSLTIASP